MKKLLTILLALLMVLSLAACGSKKDDEPTGGADIRETQSLNVRKAMTYAIDRVALAKSLNDGSIAAEGIIPFALASNPVTGADFREDQGPVVAYDEAKAKEFYAAACEELGKKEISIDLLYGTNEGDAVIKCAEQVAYYLEEVGFSVNLVAKQKKERLDLMKTGDYEVSLTRWGPDYGDPQTYMDLYVSTNLDNNSGRYNSEVYDKLVAEAEETTDTTERWNKFLEAEKVIVQEDAGIVPVFQAGNAMIMRPGVSGIEFHSAAVDNYRHLVGKDTITVVTATDIIDLDTCVATDGTSFVAMTQYLAGLTELDPDGNPIPDLATWDLSDDGLTYTFHIREDANWSNGTPVTAADFVYAWDRLQSDEIASEYSWWIDICLMDSYTAEDDKTLVVKMARPNALLPSLMAFPVTFPINQEFCESLGDQYAKSPESVLACGPYKLTSWTQGYSYEFELNEGYFGYEDYKAAGAAEKVVFRVLTDSQTALMEYDAGNIDTVILTGEQVSANSGVEGFTNRLQGYLFYLSININH